MSQAGIDPWFDPTVALADARTTSYETSAGEDLVQRALATVAASLGWSTADGGLFGGIIAPGARVLVKPNLVLHENEGPWGIEPLVTHSSIIRGVVEGALRSGAASVSVGDAPIQS